MTTDNPVSDDGLKQLADWRDKAVAEATKGLPSQSDVVALKKKHKAELDESQAEAGKTRDLMTSLEAAKEQLEDKLKESSSVQAKLEEAELKLGLSELARKEQQDKSLSQRRESLVKLYPSLDSDALKEKTPEQLDALEEALTLVGKPNANKYAVGSLPGGPTAPTTAKEKIRAGLDELKK